MPRSRGCGQHPRPQACGSKTPFSATPGGRVALTHTPKRARTGDARRRGSSPRKGRGTDKLRSAARPGRFPLPSSVQARARRGPRARARPASAARGARSAFRRPRRTLTSQAPCRPITTPGCGSSPHHRSRGPLGHLTRQDPCGRRGLASGNNLGLGASTLLRRP